MSSAPRIALGALYPRAGIAGAPGGACHGAAPLRAVIAALGAEAVGVGVFRSGGWLEAVALPEGWPVKDGADPLRAVVEACWALDAGRLGAALVVACDPHGALLGFLVLRAAATPFPAPPLGWIVGFAVAAGGAAADGAALQRAVELARAQARLAPAAIGAVELLDRPAAVQAAAALGQAAAAEGGAAWANAPAEAVGFAGVARLVESLRCGQVFVGEAPAAMPTLPGLRFATRMVPWLTPPSGRHGMVVGDGAVLVLTEDRPSAPPQVESRLAEHAGALLPLAAADEAGLVAGLDALAAALAGGEPYRQAAQRLRADYARQLGSPLAAGLVARSQAEAEREVAFLRRGLAGPAADVRTPLGSFTSRAPLGATGGIAFVYPGAGSGYPGMGSGLFGLFPRLFALLEEREQNAAEALGGVAALFPPELGRLDAAALEALERSLAGDFHAQLNGTLFHSYVLTALAREVLGLRPARALGYCIGELAMFGAMGIWRDISQLNRRPPGLPVVRRRIFEDMEAVRDSWGLPPGAAPVPALWRTHVLFTTPAAAEAALREESQVYLVVVNTPGQVVVAGDAEGCARVIARLGCRAMPVPFNAPFHCDAIASERAMLTEWLRLATTADPGVTFHSLHATPLHQDEASIAAAISAMLTSRFDFPALIDQAYDAGARIFLELGARQLCSSWISESLGQRRHAAIPFDIKGADPAMALLRAMAQLVGHRVPCDISSLFGDTAELPSQI